MRFPLFKAVLRGLLPLEPLPPPNGDETRPGGQALSRGVAMQRYSVQVLRVNIPLLGPAVVTELRGPNLGDGTGLRRIRGALDVLNQREIVRALEEAFAAGRERETGKVQLANRDPGDCCE